jgi:hydroxymethylbilane synthase
VTTLRIATRGSTLARWQADYVAGLLTAAHGVACEMVIVTTAGDQRADVPIHALGGTGVFVKEVQQALLDRRADIAVHSAKDLPSLTPSGLELACVPARADARDALVGSCLADLAPGAVVATGSVRRRVQLSALRADLRFAELRGNIDSRVRKASEFGAIAVAVAGLIRLGLDEHINEILDPAVMLPQVGQGALAVECRADDAATLRLLDTIDALEAHHCVLAERAFLAGIGGGCDQPVGALATGRDGVVTLDALVADLDGVLHRTREVGTAPSELGAAAARTLKPALNLRAWRGDSTQVREGGVE